MERLARKEMQLKGYDYSTSGGYFITICTKGKRCLFWKVGASCARPVLSGFGEAVAEELRRLSTAYPAVRLDKAVIMPNHVHMLLVLTSEENGRAQLAPTVSHIVQ